MKEIIIFQNSSTSSYSCFKFLIISPIKFVYIYIYIYIYTYIHIYILMCVSVYMRVYFWEKERKERERESGGGRERDRERDRESLSVIICVYVCNFKIFISHFSKLIGKIIMNTSKSTNQNIRSLRLLKKRLFFIVLWETILHVFVFLFVKIQSIKKKKHPIMFWIKLLSEFKERNIHRRFHKIFKFTIILMWTMGNCSIHIISVN